jgi:hypothetical protein
MQPDAKLYNLASGVEIKGYTRDGETVFDLSIQPHSYVVLKWEK